MNGCLAVIIAIAFVLLLNSIVDPILESIPSRTKGTVFGVVLIISLIIGLRSGGRGRNKAQETKRIKEAVEDAERIEDRTRKEAESMGKYYVYAIVISAIIIIGYLVIASLYIDSVIAFGCGIIVTLTVVGAVWEHCGDIQKQKLEAERAEEEKNRLRVKSLQNQYRPLKIEISRDSGSVLIAAARINEEVADVVKKYKDDIVESPIYNELRTLLLCEGCRTEAEKYTYLSKNIEKIKVLKQEYDVMLASRVMLLNENAESMFELKLAFQYLLNSKRCVSSEVNVKKFISAVRPKELDIFQYENEPVVLFLRQYYFCLFNHVILVFDSEGIFVNAMDSSAFRIEVRRVETDVFIENGEFDEGECVAEDSKCIRQGQEEVTWLHTCRDGSPDLRYRRNPRVRYRVDTYEYAVITFTIAKETIIFEVSSSAAIDAFDKIKGKYIRGGNSKREIAFDLLQLMKIVSDDDDSDIRSIIDICTKNESNENYFCKIVKM